MKTLVAYASRHGSTKGIAERIAERLRAAGLEATALPVKEVRDVAPYDAVIVGSALYMFHWLPEARSFAGRIGRMKPGKPVWLFSSGPIEAVDKQGRNPLEVSGPREIDDLTAKLNPRDHRVFFGAWDRSYKPIGIMERFVQMMPAAREALPSADMRDWPAIEAWADGIARELTAR